MGKGHSHENKIKRFKIKHPEGRKKFAKEKRAKRLEKREAKRSLKLLAKEL